MLVIKGVIVMRKLAILILAIFVFTLTGGQTMYAQLFRPLELSPNDNFLKNSGFWGGSTTGFEILNGSIDLTKKFDGCYGIKSDSNGILHIKYTSDVIYGKVGISSFKIISTDTSNLNYSGNIDPVEYTQGADTEGISSNIFINSFLNNTELKIEGMASWFYKFPNANTDKAIASYKIQTDFYISCTGTTWLYMPKVEQVRDITANSTDYIPSINDVNTNWDYDAHNYSYQSAKIGNIKNILSYSYHKSLTQVGDFSMTFSKYEKYASLVVEDTFIYIEGDWLVVNNVKLDNDIYTVTGFDGKGLLMQRITLYDVEQATGAMGYDICQGSTEAVAKHYVANNIVNPLDDNRKIVGVALGDNQDRGIQNDSYMSRLEPLHEVIEKLCKFANIGYDIKVDLMNNKQIFDIVDITDKSASQRDRPQIIFEKNRHNVLSLSREFGNSNEKNCYYATKSGGNLEADAITILVTPTDTVAKGIKRREMHLNVSCDSVADIALYAKQQMTPYQKTNSFAIATSDVANYGKLFFIGDKVTIRDTELNITEDLIINGVKVDEANGSKNVVLEFGESKPKLIRDFNNKINNKGV